MFGRCLTRRRSLRLANSTLISFLISVGPKCCGTPWDADPTIVGRGPALEVTLRCRDFFVPLTVETGPFEDPMDLIMSSIVKTPEQGGSHCAGGGQRV
jgi:hypothetical protein